jgi:N-acetylmuramoyl-L-alanine amidase
MNPVVVRTYFLLFSLLFFNSPLFAQTSYPEVSALEGDGIYTLLRRHGLDPSAYLNPFLELNGDKIGQNNTLFIGKTYRLPLPDSASVHTSRAAEQSDAAPDPELALGNHTTASNANENTVTTPAVLEYPLFGKKYARVEVIDQQLKGAVYYLVSGHGGPDPGAIGKYGPYLLSEDEYAYDVSIRLARRLMEHGATVYMIIQDPNNGIRDENILLSDTDEICYPNLDIPYSQKARLRQRTAAVNAIYPKHKGAYQRMLAIHVDSRSKSQNIDVFFYHHENSPLGKKLAESIQNTFISKYARYQPNREYFGNVTPRSSLYVVKYSHPPAVFVELGNIMNQRDQRRFVLPDNRQALANWICEGIINDYE